jgi:DNA-binding MarR family transcriptional regulator
MGTRTGRKTNRLDEGIGKEDITLLIGKVRALGLKMTDARLSRYGLDLRHYSILSAVEDGGAPSQRELADYLNLEPRRAMSVIDNLEERGLLTRRTDPVDRRSNIIEATPKGLEILGYCRQIVKSAEDDYLSVLTPEQCDQLRAYLIAVARPPVLDFEKD